ncbi:MAG: KpsF/GutQ family sugar-phosphate isomerase [Pseudomonadota bacterium]
MLDKSVSGTSAVASALKTLQLERDGLDAVWNALNAGLGAPFSQAVQLLSQQTGRVIVTGIGKSGHIGQKIAATFASTGTPSFFVHPSEASHGDLGMITPQDIILAISWSGETVELTNIIAYSRRFNVPLIALTSSNQSALGQASDVCLALPKSQEACPHGLAPTTSTCMQLALGDGLAIALLESKGFSAHDFKVFHPGGSLGASLKYVADLMHTDDSLPLTEPNAVMADALLTMTTKSFGCLGVVEPASGRLIGVLTDGDLRRHMGDDLVNAKVCDVMTANPTTVSRQMLASSALELMNSKRITALFVVDDSSPVGIIHVHDLLRAGVI